MVVKFSGERKRKDIRERFKQRLPRGRREDTKSLIKVTSDRPEKGVDAIQVQGIFRLTDPKSKAVDVVEAFSRIGRPDEEDRLTVNAGNNAIGVSAIIPSDADIIIELIDKVIINYFVFDEERIRKISKTGKPREILKVINT